jgi:hypothetical protein
MTETAALRAARSASAEITYTALNAENTMLRQEVTHLRAKLECSQLALAHAVRELERHRCTHGRLPIDPCIFCSNESAVPHD